MTCFFAGRSMPAYLRWLKSNPNIVSTQLASSCLLKFLFLLLHTLQVSELHLRITSKDAQANISIRPDQSLPGLPSQRGSSQLLPNLEHNAVGDLTCLDARWCPPDTVSRRIGEMMLLLLNRGVLLLQACHAVSRLLLYDDRHCKSTLQTLHFSRAVFLGNISRA